MCTRIEKVPLASLCQDCVFSTWNQWSVCQNQVGCWKLCPMSSNIKHPDVEPSHGCARWINRSVRVMWIPNHSMEVRPVTWRFRLSQCIVCMQIEDIYYTYVYLYYIYIYRLMVTVNYSHSESQFCSSKFFWFWGKGSTKETRPCGGPEPKPCLYSWLGLHPLEIPLFIISKIWVRSGENLLHFAQFFMFFFSIFLIRWLFLLFSFCYFFPGDISSPSNRKKTLSKNRGIGIIGLTVPAAVATLAWIKFV